MSVIRRPFSRTGNRRPGIEINLYSALKGGRRGSEFQEQKGRSIAASELPRYYRRCIYTTWARSTDDSPLDRDNALSRGREGWDGGGFGD